MYAGIDFIFKNETALNLLSPAIIWNDLNPVFLTVMGCIIPNCSIELANWDILSFSKFVLGWKGFVLIWSIGISITLPINLSSYRFRWGAFETVLEISNKLILKSPRRFTTKSFLLNMMKI